MSIPNVKVTVRFASGPAFGNVLVLDSLTDGLLGLNVLGTQATTPVDVSSMVQGVSIRRGRTRILDEFEAGTATIRLIDTDGTFDPDNGPYAGQLLPLRQVRITTSYNGVGYYLFSGFIDDLIYDYDLGADVAYVTLSCTDTFRLLALDTLTTITGATAGQLSGARIEDIFQTIVWPESLVNIDAGDSTLQADSGDSRSALQAIQDVAASELGAFFMTGDGIARFISRHGTIQQSAATPLVFTDDGTGIDYNGISLAIDDTMLANEVTVQNEGGTPQTVSDATSIAAYFRRSLNRTGLLLDSDSEALDQARSILLARKDPELRIDSIQLQLADGDPTKTAAALSADFYTPITVSRTQPGGGVVTRTLTVQGIEHDIGIDSWRVGLSTAEQMILGFVLDSPRDGILGSDVLAY